MDFNAIQIFLVFVVAFIAAIDQFSLLESLYQPIVTGAVVGAILGDAQTGLLVGGTYQLMTIGNMPVGGAQPPNAVIGGIMATVFAIGTKLDPAAAVGLAVPFALIGQYMVTLLFTVMSPLMSVADRLAETGDTKGIVRLNWLAMIGLGILFGIVCVIGLVSGAAAGEAMTKFFDQAPWVMSGLSAAGGMMRFVGFAVLLRIMLSKDLWGIYFAGFSLATIMGYITLTTVEVVDGVQKVTVKDLSGSALLLIAFIGIAIALNDFQTRCAIKNAAPAVGANGGDEDGI
ncbi:MAG: PTS sugar transporter subunit IIC [Lachnospiraceae bacterium]|nr:PTS sugar transporter subunit IIC [Lachnospiraceae bacterium]MDY5742189.1 PTS sugar transporter subunit IIC [Lachnospiraceae bacterium]